MATSLCLYTYMYTHGSQVRKSPSTLVTWFPHYICTKVFVTFIFLIWFRLLPYSLIPPASGVSLTGRQPILLSMVGEYCTKVSRLNLFKKIFTHLANYLLIRTLKCQTGNGRAKTCNGKKWKNKKKCVENFQMDFVLAVVCFVYALNIFIYIFFFFFLLLYWSKRPSI